MGVNCCHANQDKFWAADPDGVEWEVYHLNYDLEDESPAVRAPALPMAKDRGVLRAVVLLDRRLNSFRKTHVERRLDRPRLDTSGAPRI